MGVAGLRLVGDRDDGADPACWSARAINAIETLNKSELLPLALAIIGASVLRMGLTDGEAPGRRQGLPRG